MRSFGWLLLAAAVTCVSMGCGSGGTNDVTMVGASHGEEPGPKGNGYKLGGSVAIDNRVGTVAALCVQACSHLRAADCEGDPAYKVADCPSDCGATSSASSKAPECDDELAAYYRCLIGATVECSSAGQPKVPCTDQDKAHESCVSHGSGSTYPGCVGVTSNDYQCVQYYGATNYKYYQCSSAYMPNPNCIMVGSGNNAFCCP